MNINLKNKPNEKHLSNILKYKKANNTITISQIKYPTPSSNIQWQKAEVNALNETEHRAKISFESIKCKQHTDFRNSIYIYIYTSLTPNACAAPVHVHKRTQHTCAHTFVTYHSNNCILRNQMY